MIDNKSNFLSSPTLGELNPIVRKNIKDRKMEKIVSPSDFAKDFNYEPKVKTEIRKSYTNSLYSEEDKKALSSKKTQSAMERYAKSVRAYGIDIRSSDMKNKKSTREEARELAGIKLKNINLTNSLMDLAGLKSEQEKKDFLNQLKGGDFSTFEGIRNKLEEIHGINDTATNTPLYQIRLGMAQNQIQNILSNEQAKAMRGEKNFAKEVNDWIEKHPLNEAEKAINYPRILKDGMRGMGNMGELVTGAFYVPIAKSDDPALEVVKSFAIGAGINSLSAPLLTKVPILAKAPIVGKTLIDSSEGMAAQVVTGMNLRRIDEMRQDIAGGEYMSMIEKGYNPDVARIVANTSGLAQVLVEEAQLDQLGNMIPYLSKSASAIKKKATQSALHQLAGLAKVYGLETFKGVASEALEEVGQQAISTYADSISRQLTDKAPLSEALITGIKDTGADMFYEHPELYIDTAKQTVRSVLLLGVVGNTLKAGIDYKGSSTAAEIDYREQEIENAKSKQEIRATKKFMFDKDGLGRVFAKVKDPKVTSDVKAQVIDTAYSFRNAVNHVLNSKNKSSNFTPGETAKLKDIAKKADETVRDYITEFKKDNKNTYLNDSDVDSNRNKLLELAESDDVDPFTLSGFTGVNKAVAEYYRIAQRKSGLIDKVYSLRENGKSNIEIAEAIISDLPRKATLNGQKTKIKKNEMFAMKLINAIDTVDREAFIHANSALSKNLDLIQGVKVGDEGLSQAEPKQLATQREENKSEITDKMRDELDQEQLKELSHNEIVEKITPDNSSNLEDEVESEVKRQTVDLNTVKKNIDIQKADVYKVNLDDIVVNESAFQFRQKGTNPAKFANVEWNERLGGTVTLYRDENGNLNMVNGHHRLEIARNSGVEAIDARIIDSSEMNMHEARMQGALINIAEDHASPVDVAELFRNDEITPDELKRFGIRQNSNLFKIGKALSNLDDNLYNMVINNQLSEERAGAIANSFPDDKHKQLELYSILKDQENKGRIISADEIRFLKSALYDTGEYKDGGFLTEHIKETYAIEKMDLMKYAFNELKYKKNLLKKVTKDKNLSMLKSLGNDIDVDISSKTINESEIFSQTLSNAFKRGNKELRGVIDTFALRLRENPSDGYLKRSFLDNALKIINDNEIDINGLSKSDYVEEIQPMYHLEKNDVVDSGALFRDDIKNNGVYKFNGEINPDFADVLNQTKGAVTLVNNYTNNRAFKDVGIAINHLMNNEYFNDTVFVLDGKDDSKFFSREELDQYGYKGYEEGNYKIKGRFQKIGGNRTDGVQGIFLSNGADKRTVAEETIHLITDKERVLNSELHKKIEAWKEKALNKAEEYGVILPDNDELFAKAFLEDRGGFTKGDFISSYILNVPDELYQDIANIVGEDFIREAFGDDYPADVVYNKPRYSKVDLDRNLIDMANDKARVFASMNLDTDSKMFKDRFRDSKVVDFKGDPLIVYADTKHDFNVMYSVNDNGGSENYLRIEKPYKVDSYSNIDWEEVNNNDYDGIEICSGRDTKYILLDSAMKFSAYNDGSFLYELEPEFGERKFYKTNEGSISDRVDDDSKVYEKDSNKAQIDNADKWIDEVGIEGVEMAVLENEGILTPVQVVASWKIANELSDIDPDRASRIVSRLAENSTDVAQILQSYSNVPKLTAIEAEGILQSYIKQERSKLGRKGEIEQNKITEATKKAVDRIKKGNLEAIKNIKYSEILSELDSTSDFDLALNNMRSGLNADTINSIKTMATEFNVSEQDILSGNISDEIRDMISKSENKNYDKLVKFVDRNKVTRSDVVDRLNKFNKAVYDHYKKGSTYTLAEDLEKAGFTKAVSNFLSSKVKSKVGDMTFEDRTELFKELAKNKGKKNSTFNDRSKAFDKWNDSAFVGTEQIEGEIADGLGYAGLTEEMKEFIAQKGKQIDFLEDMSDKNLELNKLINRLNAEFPQRTGDKLKSYRVIAMLLNPKTTARNLVGNYGFGLKDTLTTGIISPMVDRLVAIKTGQRTRVLHNPIKNQIKGNVIGFKDGIRDVKSGLNLSASDYANSLEKHRDPNSKVEIDDKSVMKYSEGADPLEFKSQSGKIRITKNSVFDTGVLGVAEKALNYGLQVPDRAAISGHYLDRVAELEKIYEKAGIKIDEKNRAFINTMALEQGLDRTFNDDNLASTTLVKLRNTANKININGFGLGDAILPFAKVPANVVMRGADYSPIGLVRGMHDLSKALFDKHLSPTDSFRLQNKGVDLVSRGIAGTIDMFGIGFLLTQLGILTPPRTGKDDKLDKFKKSLGYRKGSFNIDAFKRFLVGKDTSLQPGDRFYDYNSLQPLATPIATGSAIYEASKNGNEAVDTTIKGIAAGINSVLDLSILQGVIDPIKYGDGEPTEIAKHVGINLVSSFVPTLSGAIATFIDPTQKDVFRKDTFLNSVKNKTLSRIPLISKSVPTKKDVFGNDLSYASDGDGLVRRFYNSFLNTMNTSVYNPDTTTALLTYIAEETGDTSIIPSEFKNDFNGYKIDETLYNDICLYRGDLLKEALADDVEYYASAESFDGDEAIKTLSGIVSKVQRQVRDEVNIGLEELIKEGLATKIK